MPWLCVAPFCCAQVLAVLVWSATRMGSRPKKEWLLAFRARAIAQYGSEAAGQLARLVALAVAGQAQRQLLKQQQEAAPQ